MNKDKVQNQNILGTLNNADESGIIANASQIYDGVAQKSVEERITDLDNKIESAVAAETSRAQEAEANRYTKNETYTKEELNNLITTPNQEYVSVIATKQTTVVTDVLPDAGAANTIYRVGNWDGSQYDTTCYTEYAWNGSIYVPLNTKEYGIDDVPTAGSNNLVKSGGVYSSTPTITNSTTESDFDISDEQGNVLVRFAEGHLQVKNFSTADALESIQAILSNIGFDNVPEFSEEDDYAVGDIVRYGKYVYVFTSVHTAGVWNESEVEKTVINTEHPVDVTNNESESDLDISDEQNNVLARFAGGHLQVKNFSTVDVLDSIQAILSNVGFDNVPAFDEETDYAVGDTVRYGKYVYVFTSAHTAGEWNDAEAEKTVLIPQVKVTDNDLESDLDFSDEEGNVLMRLANGHIKTKYFDSSELSNKKYVDCIGDSLTMGASWLGWYETNLQTLLGSKYTVRNWGVGGETKSTIMARQGSASVKFSSSFVLPADGTNVTLPIMKSRFDNGNVTPLLQGSTVDASHTSKMVNPCFIAGVECIMSNSGTTYYLKRKNVGDRDLVIDENAPILMNTGKQTKDAFVTIVWFGTNGKPTSNEQSDELVSAYERVVTQLPNSNFIFVGLHTLGRTLAEYYENAMFEKFGNKFFNIREYCCSDLLYDARITPTQADLENMANGICPASALYDNTHFKPVTNNCIGRRLYEMIVQLGYINN